MFGTNCVPWQLTIQVTNRLALKCVPLYDTLGADKVEYMINHAEVKAIAVASEKVATLAKTLEKIKGMVKVVMYWGDEPDSTLLKSFAEVGIEILGIDQMEAEGAGTDVEDPPTPEDICTIMYTSGTECNRLLTTAGTLDCKQLAPICLQTHLT